MEKTDKQAKGNIVKVVLTGPESTGKSTIAKKLAQHFKTVWVKEFLREFAEEKYSKNQPLVYTDNLLIAEGQIKLEQEAIKDAKKYIFCDTDILQTVIYSHEYYNKVQQKLEKKLQSSNTDLYILLNLDVSWEEDHLRDKPNDRSRMFKIFEDTLIKFNKKYIILEGKGDIRLQNAINIVEKHFNNKGA
jgi:NadR type nicotinamide-nucleotide adenylyltransferase